ncbi:MAG: class I SAM-dependent methyltransferase [Acidobacteriota bacterium]
MTAKYARIDPSPFSANQRILEMVPDGSCVLDVGCATGYLAAELKRRDCRVLGIDVSAEAAGDAARYCERVWNADIDTIESLDCARVFDYIIFADVLEHTVRPDDNVRKFFPYLRDGGRILCSIPNIANWKIRLSLLAGRFEYEQVGILDESHLRFFTKRTAQQMFRRLGLRTRRMTVTPSVLPYGLYRVFPLKWLDYALCRAWPSLLAQQFVFELEREGQR